ncbi:MAG: FAD-dependent monooxygenase [Limnohabitans sp.]|jgi:2-polyprenyl-6-methoxyphenol hydroxylase-like FAD-dependent oxidoreductase
MARILVIGGSLGGLFVANMLHRDGHDVQVLEKVKGSMNGRGAGIVSHDALVKSLERAGLDVQATLGVEVPGRVLLDQAGQSHIAFDMPQVLTSWSRLYQILRAALPADRYFQGVSVSRVEEQGDIVQVFASADGQESVWSADIVIASDGIRSNVRQQFFPQVQPQYAGYIAWRGVCDESLLSNLTQTTLFDYFGFCVPPDEQIIGYPVAGSDNNTSRGHRAYNFVWYRPATGDELQAVLTDADGVHYPQGIPPNKVSWQQLAHVRAEARRLLSPQFAEILEKTPQPFLQPIFDLESNTLTVGRVALMGDAAFVARPHIGMGVAKASEDAVALADAIRTHGANPDALAAYAQIRLPAGRYAVRRARWLGSYVKSPDGSNPPMAQRQHQAIHETAIDLGRYGHQSAFKDESL